MALIEGVVIGKVKNDPESGKQVDGQGNIYVQFPWLVGKQGYWAPVATAMAGNDRGTWLMPEVDDEVLIAFDHGDVDHPYVLGFLWNGKAVPPQTDPEQRLIKSKKGHTILLDDTDGKEKIVLTTGQGMTITMDDPAKSITIKAAQSVIIEGPESVVVKATTVTVEASEVQVNAGSISLGKGASHPAVWGDVLQEYLETLSTMLEIHTHEGAAGPTSPPVPLPLPPPPFLSPVVRET